MNAPDKIYMPNELLSEEWQRHIVGEDTEYIRKAALLKWAKKKKTCLEKLFDAIPATAIGAKIDACNELIEKLNSM